MAFSVGTPMVTFNCGLRLTSPSHQTYLHNMMPASAAPRLPSALYSMCGFVPLYSVDDGSPQKLRLPPLACALVIACEVSVLVSLYRVDKAICGAHWLVSLADLHFVWKIFLRTLKGRSFFSLVLPERFDKNISVYFPCLCE